MAPQEIQGRLLYRALRTERRRTRRRDVFRNRVMSRRPRRVEAQRDFETDHDTGESDSGDPIEAQHVFSGGNRFGKNVSVFTPRYQYDVPIGNAPSVQLPVVRRANPEPRAGRAGTPSRGKPPATHAVQKCAGRRRRNSPEDVEPEFFRHGFAGSDAGGGQ